MRYDKLILISLLLCHTAAAFAGTPSTEEIAQSIFTSIMSPYCPGKLLSDCPSGQASDLKKSVREELAKGKSKEEVLSHLKDEYGEETLKSEPDLKGFGAVAWAAPILFLLIGLALAVKFIKSAARK